MKWNRNWAIATIALLSLLIAWQTGSRAQTGDARPAISIAKPGTRFEFEVIESFNAKYLGDTPGHLGRAGGLESRPRVALGDPVYREETQIGTITAVVWSRVQGSMAIEFDPVPLTRICVGDRIWLDLNPSAVPEVK
jgi:hypothetical protein